MSHFDKEDNTLSCVTLLCNFVFAKEHSCSCAQLAQIASSFYNIINADVCAISCCTPQKCFFSHYYWLEKCIQSHMLVALKTISLLYRVLDNVENGLSTKTLTSVRKCIWMCCRYVIKFLMLIWEMAFVFHKRKQAKTRVSLKKLSKTINITEVSFCSNE